MIKDNNNCDILIKIRIFKLNKGIFYTIYSNYLKIILYKTS